MPNRDGRIRQAIKTKPLYPLNQFPASFASKLAREIFLHKAKSGADLEGNKWEEIFAKCIGATWTPSAVGLDDVRHQPSSTAWGAKTVKGAVRSSSDAAEREERVRLISGRNSPAYSFDRDVDRSEMDPNEIGKMVLDIWNMRIREIRRTFSNLRTVVLIKDESLDRIAVFEHETVLFIPEDVSWSWNIRRNLIGEIDGVHRFTWQPHGSQFTIIEAVPANALRLEIDSPAHLDDEALLKQLKFGPGSFRRI